MPAATTDRTNPIPLYAQVKQILQQEIESGMQPGSPLPSEPELEKRFDVSRITIRRALDELVSEGLIVRRQGKGTFVREQPISQELPMLLSWSWQMREKGYEPRTLASEIDMVEHPSRDIASLLEITPDICLVRIRRLRCAGDDPICIMTNYVPESLVPNLAREGLREDSLYATLAHYGIVPKRAEDKVEARPATDWEAEMLGVPEWSPLLQVTRLTRDAANKPLYVSVVANRADKYAYTIHFSS